MAIEIPAGTYLSAAEAAEYLGVSGQRVSRLAKEGKLPSIEASGRLIPIEAVEARVRRLQESSIKAGEQLQAQLERLQAGTADESQS